MFPEGTNVEFAEVEAPGSVRILIWERGVGPTHFVRHGVVRGAGRRRPPSAARRATPRSIAPGGAQRVEWRDDSVYLTGWAEVLCDGEWLRQFPPR